MTKGEFLRAVPDIIIHHTHGYGELSLTLDKDGSKTACYKHRDKACSLGCSANSYQELYLSLTAAIQEMVKVKDDGF